MWCIYKKDLDSYIRIMTQFGKEPHIVRDVGEDKVEVFFPGIFPMRFWIAIQYWYGKCE